MYVCMYVIVARVCTFSRVLCRLCVITCTLSFNWFTQLSLPFLIARSNFPRFSNINETSGRCSVCHCIGSMQDHKPIIFVIVSENFFANINPVLSTSVLRFSDFASPFYHIPDPATNPWDTKNDNNIDKKDLDKKNLTRWMYQSRPD